MEENKKLKNNSVYLRKVSNTLDEIKALLEEQESESALEYVEWLKAKTELKYYKALDENLYIVANSIYWANLGINIDSEQDYYRPVLVVHTQKSSPTCSVIPLTTQKLNDEFWYHVDLENGKSTALLENLKVISKKRIDKPKRVGGRIEQITAEDWKNINRELQRLYTLKSLRQYDKGNKVKE